MAACGIKGKAVVNEHGEVWAFGRVGLQLRLGNDAVRRAWAGAICLARSLLKC